MFCWQSRDRLCFPRMVWLEHNYNEPKYELVKYRSARGLRAWPRLIPCYETKVDNYLWKIRKFPGIMGYWPLNRRPKRPKKKT